MPAPNLDDLGLALDCGREVIGDLADDPGSRFLIELSLEGDLQAHLLPRERHLDIRHLDPMIAPAADTPRGHGVGSQDVWVTILVNRPIAVIFSVDALYQVFDHRRAGYLSLASRLLRGRYG